MRPGRSLKKSVLESKNKEVTETAKDLEGNAKLNSSEETTKRQIDEKPIFKLVLPPDLAKELESSSDDMVIISSSSKFTRSTRKKSTRKTKNFTRRKPKPTVEILSSSGENGEEGEEDLADGCPSSSTKEVGHSSVEDNEKSLLDENNSLVSSKKLSQENNLSTSKRHRKISYQMKQKLIQSKKENETDSENSGDDPFGFDKAERRVREKKVIQSLFSSDNSQKLEENQDDSNVQSEIIQNISLDEEKNRNDTDSSEFDKQDRTQRKQENNEYYSSDEIEKDDDNDNDQHDEGHISTEIDKRSAEFSELTPLKDKNKTVEKKNNKSSKVQEALNITKTADLVSLLPLRRAPKKKIDNRLYDNEDDENELSLDEEKRNSDFEEKKSPMKRKMQGKKSEKRSRKIKKETLSWESNEFDEKPKHERAERARRTYEIDNFELSEEVV